MARNVDITMSESSDSVVFSLRLSGKELSDWRTHCERQYDGISATHAVRLLMRNDMGVALDGSGKKAIERKKFKAVESVRGKLEYFVKAYFSDSELAAISTAAEQAGISKSLWVARSVRASLRIDSEPTFAELEAIITSNKELSMVGRNLNQIARRLNQDVKTVTVSKENFDTLTGNIKAHIKRVNKLIRSCVNRWDLE